MGQLGPIADGFIAHHSWSSDDYNYNSQFVYYDVLNICKLALYVQ